MDEIKAAQEKGVIKIMGHVLVVGSTGTGKTSLGVELVKNVHNDLLYIYDPMFDPRWNDRDNVFYDPGEFMKNVEGPCVAVIDEADTILDNSKAGKLNHWIAVRGRHYSIACVFITQRPAMISPTVRNQIDTAYVFRVSRSDSDVLGRDLAVDLSDAAKLKRGEYLAVAWSGEGEKTVSKKSINLLKP